MRFITYLISLLVATFLAACGGGGGSPGLPSVTKTPVTTTAGAALTLAVGATGGYVITGGTAPYQISSSDVQVAVANLDSRNFWINGVASGSATVTVSDASQQSTAIVVTVANLAKFSTTAPLAINIAPKSTSLAYSITGGVQGAKYQWSSTDTRVATAQIDGNVLRINGLVVGVATITLRDNAPTPALIDIIVTVGGGTVEPLYTTAPPSLSVAPLSLTTFPIGGGVPPYQLPSSTDSRVATASINAAGNTLSILAGTSLGSTTIIVFDSARNGISINVTVAGGTKEPLYTTVPATGLTIGIGLTREFTVGGGVADYTVSSTEEGIATVSKDSNNKLYIKGIAAGKADITVRDRVGTTLIYKITVGSSSAITHTAPASLTMVAGTARAFTISGGNPPYVASSSNEAAAIASSNGSTLTISAINAGSATIKVVDLAGTEGPSITVTVTGGSSGTPGTPAPSSVEVVSSTSSLLSAGAEAVITAYVKDSGNVGIANQSVTFLASSGVIQSASAVTNAAGVATAKLIPGSDKSNRPILVRVVSGTAVSGQVTVQVTGTSVTIAGPTSLQVSTVAKPVTASYTLRALDSSSNPIAGATLTLSSTLGNTLDKTSVTTDATGTATVVYTPVNSGTDSLKVTGLGATAESAISVSAIDLSVVTPAPNTTIPIGTVQVVTVLYQLNGVPQPGQTVAFSTTRGTITATTSALGQYSANLSSATAGLATVTAQIAGVGSVTLPIEFVATVPATVTLQSNPGAIAPNATGTTNQSTVSAVVRDSAGNPVKDRQVNFTLISDLSNGTLSSGSAITNSNGQASVQFIAGPTSTPNEGVVVTAVDSLTGISGTTKLTVSGQSLFITIGFGNEITNVDPTTYSREFSVYVTDANGVAVGNQSVTLSVIPVDYGKGLFGLEWYAMGKSGNQHNLCQ
ncbi:MAG: Ig-like domain-containing protein [Comamonadaceae bacterium]|nr:Ig-like domain-containing protein [Comamonadaceae bacterium]